MSQTETVSPTPRIIDALRHIVEDRGRSPTHVLRARIILLSQERLPVIEIARQTGVGRPTVWRWQQRFAEQGIDGLLRDKSRPPGKPATPQKEVRAVLERTLTSEPPNEATYWTGRAMAAVSGLSLSTVQRIWRSHHLHPHRMRVVRPSTGSHFAATLDDVVGLNAATFRRVIVLSGDEKLRTQALDRTQPELLAKPGKSASRTNHHVSDVTVTLIEALKLLEDAVFRRDAPRCGHQDFIAFLDQIEETVPADKALHAVMDNHAIHKHPEVLAWLTGHPRWTFHFLATSSSWLSAIAGIFSKLTRQKLRGDAFGSVDHLVSTIDHYIEHANREPKPFVWAASAFSISAKLRMHDPNASECQGATPRGTSELAATRQRDCVSDCSPSSFPALGGDPDGSGREPLRMTDAVQPTYALLGPGDPFPWFSQRCDKRSSFAVDTMAGRYIVFCFFGTASAPLSAAALQAIHDHRDLFDDARACCFGVTIDGADEAKQSLSLYSRGIRFLWDFDTSVSRLCGAVPKEVAGTGPATYQPFWLIVDPTLHVLAKIPFGPQAPEAVFTMLNSLPWPDRFAGFEIPAPILVLPNVFDQKLCRHLIDLYDRDGGSESGVYRSGSGVHDGHFKRRKDYTVEDPGLVRHLQSLIARKVLPEIEKIFFMKISRMERYIVGCYAAEDGGHFRPHRDNGPGLTAHRRFALSINLTGDFEGGEVSFPEYNPRGIKAPPGWCVVFPCAALHMVSPVTRGRRYAFLPFVYDEEGANIRKREIEAHSRATKDAEAAAVQ